MERAVQQSRKTLLVLTPAYLAGAWTTFEALLLQTLDPANQQRRLIPLRKEPCDPPLRINYLIHINLVDPHDRDQEWQRLFVALQRPFGPGPALGLPNPFTDHGRINEPDRFFGRQRVLREVQQTLAAGNSISLVGEAQIGKSSLLYYLYKTQAAWSPGRRVGYLDLQGVFSEKHFCTEVLSLLTKTGDDLITLQRVLRQNPLLLLLDEVDKLSKLIHNMLLELFDRGVAHIPHLDGHIGSYDRKSWPIVVMTSNEETELSEALMSRCCFANLKRPTLIEELNILAKRVPEATPQMVVMVGRLIAGFRMMTGYRTRPGVREAIDLLRLIAEWKVESVDRETLRKCSGLLVKNVTDSERFSGEIQLDLLLSHMEHFNEEVKQWLA